LRPFLRAARDLPALQVRGNRHGAQGQLLPDTRIVAPLNATTFYLRFTENGKRTTQPVGTVLSDAITALRNKQIAREFVKHGLDVPVLTGSGRPTIADAVAQSVKNQTALDKAASTLYVYKRAAEQFRDSCRRVNMDEIDRQAIIDHIQWVRENVPTREHGQALCGCTRLGL
jgi:hypothetical protein